MKKINIFGLGDVRGDFFRAALCSSSQGFALLPSKNGVKIAAIEGVAPSIDHHPVPKGRGCPCRGHGTGGGPRTDKARQRLKKTISDENHSVFWSKSMALPDHSRTCVSHTSSPDLVKEI